jgi:hypothetical protein
MSIKYTIQQQMSTPCISIFKKYHGIYMCDEFHLFEWILKSTGRYFFPQVLGY